MDILPTVQLANVYMELEVKTNCQMAVETFHHALEELISILVSQTPTLLCLYRHDAICRKCIK